MEFQNPLLKSAFALSAVLVVVTLSVISITIFRLYVTAVDEQREHLKLIAKSQARLIESVTQFDDFLSQSEISASLEQAIVLHVREAQIRVDDSRTTSELKLAKLENGYIRFLPGAQDVPADAETNRDEQIEPGRENAPPMRLALSGQSGTTIGIDYRGAVVLAAFHPFRLTNYGLVAKIDMAEIRRPFWHAGVHSLAAGSIIIIIGVTGFRRVTRPIYAAISNSESRYKGLFENSEVSIWNEDYSQVKTALDELRQSGVEDLKQHLNDRRDLAREIVAKVKVKQVNRASLKLYGAETDVELMKSIDQLFDENALDVFIEQLCAIWNGEKIFRSDATQRTLHKQIIDVVISMPIPETDEGFHDIPVSIIDISEYRQIEKQLEKISRAVEASSAMVIITDRNGVIEYVNPKFTEMTLYSREEVLGETPRILKSGEQSREFYEDMWHTILAGNEWAGDIRNRRKDGSLYWDRASISGVKDANGEIQYFVSIQDDVTKVYELTERLRFQASYDSLTGLINRREFEKRATQLLTDINKDESEHAMCFLDLDQFKVVNDTCGHAAGDELLNQLGKLLKNSLDKEHTLARLGGDEFGILLERCSLGSAHRIADGILKAIKGFQFVWDDQVFRIGASIGLVAITEATGNFTELFKQADVACYLAKDLGRNRIHTYHPDDTELAIRHGEMQWVGEIYQALEDDRFCLFAQPIVSLETGTQQHFELLLRLRGEDGEIIPPGLFLPAAERYNLIDKIDSWVFRHACLFLANHPRLLEQLDFFSINLSGPSLTNEGSLDAIIRNLDESGISPRKICFEITETEAVSNMETAIQFIKTLKQKGCRFAMDDFGSGISSFGYLKNLSVDFLKIDGMFVRDIVDDPIDRAMVKSINEIGQVMGMKTIAEFVENDEIERLLKDIGVDYGQGFGLGKPQPLENLIVSANPLINPEIS
ncbi:MAG: EAL domain-containing protein [Gammaproteobacteria bacterium]|nr:EAL domain-containing protein [Gammaproteobacteria bacterium]